MAAKIVPNTRSRGITPGPKLAASPTIHSRMASVKIVQNTALLLNGGRIKNLTVSVYGYVAPKKTFPVMGFDFGQIILMSDIRPISSDPNKAPQVVCALVPKSHFCADGVDY
jgi:hypothetical protein